MVSEIRIFKNNINIQNPQNIEPNKNNVNVSGSIFDDLTTAGKTMATSIIGGSTLSIGSFVAQGLVKNPKVQKVLLSLGGGFAGLAVTLTALMATQMIKETNEAISAANGQILKPKKAEEVAVEEQKPATDAETEEQDKEVAVEEQKPATDAKTEEKPEDKEPTVETPEIQKQKETIKNEFGKAKVIIDGAKEQVEEVMQQTAPAAEEKTEDKEPTVETPEIQQKIQKAIEQAKTAKEETAAAKAETEKANAEAKVAKTETEKAEKELVIAEKDKVEAEAITAQAEAKKAKLAAEKAKAEAEVAKKEAKETKAKAEIAKKEAEKAQANAKKAQEEMKKTEEKPAPASLPKTMYGPLKQEEKKVEEKFKPVWDYFLYPSPVKLAETQKETANAAPEPQAEASKPKTEVSKPKAEVSKPKAEVSEQEATTSETAGKSVPVRSISNKQSAGQNSYFQKYLGFNNEEMDVYLKGVKERYKGVKNISGRTNKAIIFAR